MIKKIDKKKKNLKFILKSNPTVQILIHLPTSLSGRNISYS